MTTTTARWDYTTALHHDPATGQTFVAIDLIHPSPQNVRRDLGDLTELAASIREQGVLQPATVTPDPSGQPQFVLVFGNRRRAATQLAMLGEMPVVVRPDLDTEAKVLEAQLAEDERENFTPVEQAEGYQRLALFDYTPQEIARRVGKSESTVRRRLRLAQLPDGTRDALHTGQITLHQADAIADAGDVLDEEAVTRIVAAVRKGPNEVDLEVGRLRRRAELEAQLRESIDQLGQYGIGQVFRVSSAGSSRPNGWRAGRMIGSAPDISPFLTRLDAGEVETPEAVILEVWGQTAYWYVAERDVPQPATTAEPDGGGEVPGQQSVEDELATQRAARARAEREQLLADLADADGIREEWLRKLVTKRITPVQQATMLRQLLVNLAYESMIDDAAVDIGGLDVDVDWNASDPMREHVAALSTPSLVQLLWALSLLPEPGLYYDDGTPYRGVAARWLDALAELGYEPTSVERDLLPQSTEPSDAGGEPAGT